MAERVQVAVKSRSRFGGQEDVLSWLPREGAGLPPCGKTEGVTNYL